MVPDFWQPLTSASVPRRSRNCPRFLFSQMPIFSVAPRGSKHSLPVFSWMLPDDDLTDSSRDQTLMAEQLRECYGNRQKEEGRWQGRWQDSAASKSCLSICPEDPRESKLCLGRKIGLAGRAQLTTCPRKNEISMKAFD